MYRKIDRLSSLIFEGPGTSSKSPSFPYDKTIDYFPAKGRNKH